MAQDQEIVKQLQQRLKNWDPNGQCTVHRTGPPRDKCCTYYDEHGRLYGLHLCALDLVQVPSEVWQCSSLQRLDLSNNQLSTLPAEVGHPTSLRKGPAEERNVLYGQPPAPDVRSV